MVYIKYHMYIIYSEIYIVSRHMKVKWNCFYRQVDTATIPNMLDTAWIQVRLDQRCAIGDIAAVERIIYDGLIVDGYEFGDAMVSQIKPSIVWLISLMWDIQSTKCEFVTVVPKTQCD